MNMAIYQIRDGLIAGWRDYTNPVYATASSARDIGGALNTAPGQEG
jgi:limonene-1,2-epoxide hydrolase